MEIYGYVRVSSTDQNEDRQMIALRQKNIAEGNILSHSRKNRHKKALKNGMNRSFSLNY